MSLFHLFPGGIHPREGMNGKTVTSGLPLQELPLPSRVIIPLQQHIGAPSKAAVQKGDHVKVGQLIGEPGGFVSAAIHASVSGTVVSVTRCIMPNGQLSPCVVIDNDFQDEWVEVHPQNHPEALTAAELAQIARNAGIVGLGGATFPTSVKLSVPADKKVDTLIINGAECEPYLSADHRLMVEHAEQIVRTSALTGKALGVQKVYIGIENNKPDALELIRKAAQGMDNVEVVSMPVRYPQGGEKQLAYALTGRKVPTGGLPMDVGIVVSNVGTMYALDRAIYEGRPLIDRAVTVSGCIKKPANYIARIGTPVEWLIDTSEGLLPQTKMLIYGGPMMGQAISRQDIPVTKGCSGVLALETIAALAEEGPCIRCGRCVSACPMRLAPAQIDRYMRKNMFEEAERAGAMNCLECGACTWACPAKRNLTQSCRVCKQIINKRRAQAAAKGEK